MAAGRPQLVSGSSSSDGGDSSGSGSSGSKYRSHFQAATLIF